MTAAKRASSNKTLRKDEQRSTVGAAVVPASVASNVASVPAAAAAPTQPSSAAVTSNSGVAADAAKGTNTNLRLEKTTVCLPIVYGSAAFFLGKKADEYHTHRWTLYVRGPNNEDLSVCIAKVVFQLHPSFAQPIRELTSPPFEVTETGWGEFEAQIRIIWKDSTEKAILVSHGIKLYPPGTLPHAPPTNTKEPVVAEHYDEVVFTDPHETFYSQLMRCSIAPRIQSNETNVQEYFKVYSDEDDFQKLVEAQSFLSRELQNVKERMRLATEETGQVEDALRQAQEAKKASSVSRSSGKSKASSVSGNATKKSKVSH